MAALGTCVSSQHGRSRARQLDLSGANNEALLPSYSGLAGPRVYVLWQLQDGVDA